MSKKSPGTRHFINWEWPNFSNIMQFVLVITNNLQVCVYDYMFLLNVNSKYDLVYHKYYIIVYLCANNNCENCFKTGHNHKRSGWFNMFILQYSFSTNELKSAISIVFNCKYSLFLSYLLKIKTPPSYVVKKIFQNQPKKI